VRTGGIDLGPIAGNVVENALLACRTHKLSHEYLKAGELMKRWPQFQLPDDWHACFDPNMGFLLVDDCLRAYADAAAQLGAEIREEEAVLEYDLHDRIRIRTTKGEYETEKLVLSAGAWNPGFLKLPLVVKRKSLVWLQPAKPEDFGIGKFPIFLADTTAGLLYGFPLYGHAGFKIANHHGAGPAIDPETVDRNFHAEDASDAVDFARNYLRGVTSNVLDGKICLYTMTPDEDFVIDLYPNNPNIAVAAGFSGHGFKFAPVVGEILADLITKGSTSHKIEKFQISRF
jgi:sarcosine oxidase